MTDLEDTNEVLMDKIDKAIEIHLGEEVGFILGCKQAWREAIHPYVRKQMEKKWWFKYKWSCFLWKKNSI